jgi:hypothetical protein
MDDCEEGLLEKLRDRSRPGPFLFGTVPPLEGTEEGKVREQSRSFAQKHRSLPVDGYIVYDIQEEKGRTNEPRPMPFRPMMDPAVFAGHLARDARKGVLVYKCFAEHTSEPFDQWAERAVSNSGVKAFNLVGGASSSVDYSGPSLEDASRSLTKRNAGIGGVTIAERHMKKGNEHNTLVKKQNNGFEWFITQAIYDPDPTIKMLTDYADRCKQIGQEPKRVVLTFTPCGRQKTMRFIHWLGVTVPEETESAIMNADHPADKSVEVLCNCLQKIIDETKHLDIPLGITVEHVSIFKEEIRCAFELVRKMQAILLDSLNKQWNLQVKVGS